LRIPNRNLLYIHGGPNPADHPGVIQPMRRWFATRRLSRAVRQGIGLREQAWDMPQRGDDSAAGDIIGQILDWMRESAASMRRPYGLDHVAVAFACRNADGKVICSNAIGVVRPSIFYSDEGARRVSEFLVDAWHAGPGEGARIIGALLCLGEVAHELGISQAA
jgi:hypothetical protein